MKPKTCEHCGIEFVAEYRVTAAYWSRRRFCSTVCRTAGTAGERRSTYRRERVTLSERFWSKVKKSRGCWEWIGAKDGAGYGYLGTTRGQKPLKAHRVSYELNIGPIGGLHVCHKCDNPICVNPAHLFLGTMQDNMADKMAKGRGGQLSGERHFKAKTTRAMAKKIHEMRKQGTSQQAIADSLGVSQNCVSKILSGNHWTMR